MSETTAARATLSVAEAGERLGVSRNLAYEAARRGEIPTIKIGGRILVPVAAFNRMLEEASQPEFDAREPVTGDHELPLRPEDLTLPSVGGDPARRIQDLILPFVLVRDPANPNQITVRGDGDHELPLRIEDAPKLITVLQGLLP